ncbi:hypothetical protein ScPMuIL_004046, partial [Solemya velum]
LKRAECVSENTVNDYYRELGTILTENGLHDKPQNIYNIDETGFSTEHSPSKILAENKTNAQALTSPRSSNVTIIGGGNAVGTAIPPFFIFPGKRWNDDFLSGAPTGSSAMCSETGWSNSEIFMKYLSEHFMNYKQRSGDAPLLILYDGHKSHISLFLADWARQKNRKRKSPNQITGRLNKKRNIKTLEETDRNKTRTANISTKKNTKKNNMNKKGNVATLENKIPDPLPGPSHYHPIENFERLASPSDTESDLDDTETVCCHCEKFSP